MNARAHTIDGADGKPHDLYPVWATKRTIRELLGICDKVLYLLVANGEVAFVKTGESQQNAALYNFCDVRAWLDGRAKRNRPDGAPRPQQTDAAPRPQQTGDWI